VSLDLPDAVEIVLPESQEQAVQAPAAAPEISQVRALGEIREMLDEQRVNRAFATLGNMYEAAGLIWSGVAPQKMKWQDAVNYCTNLEGGARLPTADDFRALSRASSYGGVYCPNLLPDTLWNSFYSSSPCGHSRAFYFSGSDGNVYVSSRSIVSSVRCVRAATKAKRQEEIKEIVRNAAEANARNVHIRANRNAGSRPYSYP
jgi:hypothetical protein